MSDKVWKIYKITGSDGRAYIGITTSLRLGRRWVSHVHCGMRGDLTSPLYVAIKEHGRDWFTIETITECYSMREAVACERAMIAVHNTYFPNGYNKNMGGGGNISGNVSDKVRETSRAFCVERLNKNPNHMLEMRAKYAAMGRPVSAEGQKRKLEGLKSAHNQDSWAKGAAKRRGRKQSASHAAASAASLKAARGKNIHALWAMDEYAKALAYRVGRIRPHKMRPEDRSYYNRLAKKAA